MKFDPEQEVSKRICMILRNARLEQNISNYKLAELTGLSESGIRHIEGLKTQPTLSNILKVSNALGLDLSDVLKLANNK